MIHRPASTAQQGHALWLLLTLLMFSASYAAYRHPALAGNGSRDAALAATLARAKAALIARAVTDDNRPGSLPCPDLITNSTGLSNFPGDGKADMFTLTQCPSYVGWLPWVTLDLPELTDDTGTRLWYVLAPALRDDDSAQPINSDTAPGLLLDGRADIAALIVAVRAPLAGQHRPSNNPADYLDGENGNGNDLRYTSGPAGRDFNDRVLPITRQELMAAVEKRVANELKSCLERHAAAHPEQRYPWPAPLSSTDLRGKPASRFGRAPATQASSGPQAALDASVRTLGQVTNRLAAESDSTQQLLIASELAEAIVRSRNQVNSIFTASSRLKQTADAALVKLQKIDSTVESACDNERISVTEGSNIRSQGSAANDFLDPLPEQLHEQGFDPLPWLLARMANELGAAGTAAALVDNSGQLRTWLAMTTSPRPDLAAGIASASLAAATTHALAQAAAADPARLAEARTASLQLVASIRILLEAIEASRVNVLSSEINDQANALEAINALLPATPGTSDFTARSFAIDSAKGVIDGIVSGVPTIVAARNAAADALAAAQNAPEQISGANGSTLVARLKQLGATIADNEAIDNNLTRTSLQAAIVRYLAARDSFAAFDTQTPRPVQSLIVPYARSVQATAVDLVAWAGLIAEHGTLIAPLARANPLPAGSSPERAGNLADSAYRSALDALNSITGKGKLADLLQTSLDKPSASNRAKALAALDNTRALTALLLERIGKLAGQLPASTASAAPMAWHSSRCDFLLPDSASWWYGNAWAGSVFYQFADPLKTAPARLRVNGEQHRLITLVAGQALAGQNRSKPGIADFFEGINADPSRNGDALAPGQSFTNTPRSASFNDRLSY